MLVNSVDTCLRRPVSFLQNGKGIRENFRCQKRCDRKGQQRFLSSYPRATIDFFLDVDFYFVRQFSVEIFRSWVLARLCLETIGRNYLCFQAKNTAEDASSLDVDSKAEIGP